MSERDRILREIEGGVPVQLRRRDGSVETRLLFFDLGATAALTKTLGVNSLNTVLKRLSQSWDPECLRAALWAGLLHAEPDLKPENLNDLSPSRDDIYELQVRLLDAINRTSMSEQELAELAINLRAVDRDPDPLELAVAINEQLTRRRLERARTALAAVGTTSGDSPGSTSASPTTPDSGDSPSES